MTDKPRAPRTAGRAIDRASVQQILERAAALADDVLTRQTLPDDDERLILAAAVRILLARRRRD